MSKRVLLLNTPFYRLMGSHFNGLSLGILYIASVLRDNGHQVAVLNADYENRNDYLDQAGIFKGYDRYKKIHEEPDHYIWNDTVDDILNYNPDYLGITMYTANYKAARIIAGKVKRKRPDIKIVVGGVHPTLASEETLSADEFDFIVAGEGEYVMASLVNGEPVKNIKGLGYKEDDMVIINGTSDTINDLNSIPLPARDLIVNPLENTDYGQLITGRGCPFSCTYCASPAMWGKRNVRLRSVDNVMEELLLIKKHYPHNIIYFVDDTFTLQTDRTMALCKRMIKENLNMEWKCDTRADCITDEKVELMKDAGCVCIKIGVESGSEKILKQINKRVTKDIILNAAQVIKKHGIPLTIYLMAGFPEETNKDLRDTIDFAKQIDANYYSLSIAAPYYGTKIYDEFVKSNGGRVKEHWEYFYHQSRGMIMNKTLSSRILNEFLSLNEGRVRI